MNFLLIFNIKKGVEEIKNFKLELTIMVNCPYLETPALERPPLLSF